MEGILYLLVMDVARPEMLASISIIVKTKSIFLVVIVTCEVDKINLVLWTEKRN